jgi:hypothetical protein
VKSALGDGGDEGDVRSSFLCFCAYVTYNILKRPYRGGEPCDTVVQWAGNHFEAVGRPDSTPA